MTSVSHELIEKPLVDQIVERTFGILTENPLIDPPLLQQLRDLGKAGGLKRHDTVASVLRSSVGESP